jgi:hypothetical protein
MAMVRREELTLVQRLVQEGVDRLEAKHRGDRKFSVRRYEIGAGITNGTLGKLIKGQTKTVAPATAKKVGALLGIPWERLVEADEQEAPPVAAEASATPPPATTVRLVVNEEHRAALSDVFDGSVHRLEDADAVRELLARKAALIEEGSDPGLLLRAWLDTAARLRERGRAATPEAILGAVTLRMTELQQQHLREVNDRAVAESKARGYERPAEVPDAIRKLGKNKPSRD